MTRTIVTLELEVIEDEETVLSVLVWNIDDEIVGKVSMMVVGLLIIVVWSIAVTVTVTGFGVMVVKDVWTASASVTVENMVRVSVPAAILSVGVIVNVAVGAGFMVDMMVSVTVTVINEFPAVPVGAPPSTGTTEYDALGFRGGWAALGCEKIGNAELGKNNEESKSSMQLDVWCLIASL